MKYALAIIGLLLGIIAVNNIASYKVCSYIQRGKFSVFVTLEEAERGCLYRLYWPLPIDGRP